MFNETRRLIRDQTEITRVTTVDCKELDRQAHCVAELVRSQNPKLTSSQTKMGDDPVAVRKNKTKWYSENNHFKELQRIDGMPGGFRLEKIPRIHDVGPPRQDSRSDERPTV